MLRLLTTIVSSPLDAIDFQTTQNTGFRAGAANTPFSSFVFSIGRLSECGRIEFNRNLLVTHIAKLVVSFIVAFVALSGPSSATVQTWTVDVAGAHSSLQLNASGNPVIAHFHALPIGDLKLAYCTAGCYTATPTWQLTTVASVGTVGLYVSMQLTASGAPVISYYDLTNTVLKLATCTANCASATPTWQIVSPDATVGAGANTSLQLDASGNPIIAYYDGSANVLKLATCTAACASAAPTWQVVTVDNSAYSGFAKNSLRLNASGMPVISYYNATTNALKLATCTSACAGATPVWQIVTVDASASVGTFSSLQLNASGDPVIGYYATTGGNLKLATCTANCASATPTWQIVVVDGASSDVGQHPSLKLNASGNPILSYYDVTNGNLMLATCTTACTTASPSWTKLVVDSLDDVGEYTSLQLNASGSPVISYHKPFGTTLKLALVLPDAFTVTATPNPAIAGGVLNCAPTSGGAAGATALVTSGQTATCTATPSSGWVTQAISGCGGTTTGLGVNVFVTGAIPGDCNVIASFIEPVACGSANSVATLNAPSANLCVSGTASAVNPVVSAFNWSCTAAGGTQVSCTAPRLYQVTSAASPIAGGVITCTPPTIAFGGNGVCTQTPNPGFVFVNWSGACSGSGACNLTSITGSSAVTANYAAAPVANPVIVPTLDRWLLLLLAALTFCVAASRLRAQSVPRARSR